MLRPVVPLPWSLKVWPVARLMVAALIGWLVLPLKMVVASVRLMLPAPDQRGPAVEA